MKRRTVTSFLAGKLGGKQAASLARQHATACYSQQRTKNVQTTKQRQVLYSLNMPSNEERREKERQRKKESRRRASEAQSETASERKETEL